MVALASRRLSAWIARVSLSNEAKSVRAARTGAGRCHNQIAKRTSILPEVPAASGGRRQRDLILVWALDGHWFDKSRIIWTLLLVDGDNFFSRNILRSWYSIALSPFASSQVDICMKIVSGMAART